MVGEATAMVEEHISPVDMVNLADLGMMIGGHGPTNVNIAHILTQVLVLFNLRKPARVTISRDI
jgi:hypothetical protein